MQTHIHEFKAQLSASESRAVYEVRLHHFWNNIDMDTEYRGSGNHRIKVISTGTWNVEPGPDFLNARLVIDGVSLSGDVEIHHRSSDWFAHKHHLDRRYANVILHVVEADDLSGDKAESLPVALKFSDLKIRNMIDEKFHKGKCGMFFSALSDDSISGFLNAAGFFRFQLKSEDILEESLHRGADRACLRMMFRALGYKRNQQAFLELFERFMDYPEDIISQQPEVILWGESGLLPDPMTAGLEPEMNDFVRSIWARWGGVRKSGGVPVNWVRSGIRPYNSPERRIAALALLLKKTGVRPLSFFATRRDRLRNPDELKNLMLNTFTGNDPLWDNYINFTTQASKSAAVLGRGQALELALNVALPSLYVFGRMDKDDLYGDLMELSRSAWMTLPATQDNRIVKIACERWFPNRNKAEILSNTACRQGVLHLFHEYCDKCQGACDACILYNSL